MTVDARGASGRAGPAIDADRLERISCDRNPTAAMRTRTGW